MCLLVVRSEAFVACAKVRRCACDEAMRLALGLGVWEGAWERDDAGPLGERG